MKAVKKVAAVVVWCVVASGCVADSPFVEAWSPEKPKTTIDNSKQIPILDLYGKRPANSFVLVKSENDAVCNVFLNAINEERDHVKSGDIGWKDGSFFKTKENIDVPELIIQTKLNIPRKNISMPERNQRAEEYTVDINKDGVDEYAYRLTLLVSSTPEHGDIFFSEKSYFSSNSYKDIFDFIREIRGKELIPGWNIKFPWISNTVIMELVMTGGEYYIVYTSFGIKYGSPIEIVFSRVEKDYTAKYQCTMQSVFSVKKY